MEVWQMILYGAASVLAVRALISAMVSHKVQYEQRRIAELAPKRKAGKGKASTAPPGSSPNERVA